MLVSQSWSVRLRLSVFWVDGRVVGPSHSFSLGQTWEMVFHRHETEVRGHSSPNSHCVCVFLYFDISNCNCDVIGERERANLVVQLAPFFCITKHGSTWYIGMAHVPRHRFHTFEKSHFHFHFQSEPSFVTTTK